MEFVDEKNDIFVATDFIHHRLDALLELAAIFCAGDHEGQVECDDAFFAEDFGNIARDDFLGEALGDRGLADARLTDEDGVVFATAAEDLDDPLDFVGTADDGVEFPFARLLGEIAPEGFERGSFRGGLRSAGSFGRHGVVVIGGSEIRIEFLEDFVAGALDVDFEILENAGGNAFAFAEQAEEHMLGADIRVLKAFRLLASEGENLFHAWRVGNIAGHLGFGTGADLLLHLHANGLEVEAHFLKDIHGDALAEFNEAEEQVLGADIVVIKPIGFLTGEGQDLLSAGSEVVHHCLEVAVGTEIFNRDISGPGIWFNLARMIVARKVSLSSEDIF